MVASLIIHIYIQKTFVRTVLAKQHSDDIERDYSVAYRIAEPGTVRGVVVAGMQRTKGAEAAMEEGSDTVMMAVAVGMKTAEQPVGAVDRERGRTGVGAVGAEVGMNVVVVAVDEVAVMIRAVP